MSEKMPRTPFSTPLSGSAKETEIRLKNIFSGPKKRPPVVFLALMFSLCVFCGNLVSCSVAEAETPAQDSAQEPAARLLTSIQVGDRILGAAIVEDHLENTLILGVMDTNTKELTGSTFRCSRHAGVPNVVTFQNYDGEDCLLYTFNGQENGQYTGEAGVVRLDGESIVWEWPVEGDVRDPDCSAEYRDYWTGHLALLAPGGVDVYTVNPEFEWGKEEPWNRWELEYGETFYADPSSTAELPIPIYFQSLEWLIGYTTDPGGWRITSLELNGERSDPEARTDCFTLTACTDNGSDRIAADLFFNYESEPGSPRSYLYLVHAEAREEIHE